MAVGLLDLPSELQTAIISCIFRPNDIANVCLVSKQLFEVTMPLLYHSMFLNVDHWTREQLDRFLAHGHSGHKYVRALDIDSNDLESEGIALKIAKDALQLLPRDRLQSFRCPLERGMDNDLMILLSANQRKLSFLALGQLTANALNVPDCFRPWPPTIETLVIPWKINVTLDIRFYQKLIARSSKTLRALTIRTENFRGSKQEPASIPHGTSQALANGLFKHYRNSSPPPKLELNDLNFQNQKLQTAGNTWMQFVDFCKLQTLQVWNCDNADSLLGELVRLNHIYPLRLHGLVLSFESPSQSPTLVQHFVGSISGLQYLNLCFSPVKPDQIAFNIKCLEKHKHSIKDLYLGIGANNKSYPSLHVVSIADLNWLVSNCRHLRQLAIALPFLRFDDAFAGDWGEYGIALRLLASLSRLKMLRILTWPFIRNREFAAFSERTQRESQRKIYLTQLDILAVSIARIVSSFRDDHHARLSVITFGSAEQWDMVGSDGRQDHLFSGPITYKIRRKETAFGLVTKARRIDARQIEYEEPIAYVVDEDTDQGLSLEGYSWGTGLYRS